MKLDNLMFAIADGLDIIEGQLLGVSSRHGRRIAALCKHIAEREKFTDDEIVTITVSALLHDSALTESLAHDIPRGELKKPHCIGGQKNVDMLPLPANASGLVLYHHERADGSGPFGKKKGDFPRAAEIISIADAFDSGLQLDGYSPDLIAAVRELGTGEEIGSLPPWDADSANAVRIGDLIARVIDYKSAFTRRHTLGIADKARKMAGFYNYGEEVTARLYLAACLHDLGKLATPSAVLEKPGKLTNEEFATIKDHVRVTYDLLRGVDPDIRDWAANHHEKLDGSGYSRGLKSQDLDFNSRLLACIDIYQAVSEERPYHPARSHEDTMPILRGMENLIDEGIVNDLDRVLA